MPNCCLGGSSQTNCRQATKNPHQECCKLTHTCAASVREVTLLTRIPIGSIIVYTYSENGTLSLSYECELADDSVTALCPKRRRSSALVQMYRNSAWSSTGTRITIGPSGSIDPPGVKCRSCQVVSVTCLMLHTAPVSSALCSVEGRRHPPLPMPCTPLLSCLCRVLVVSTVATSTTSSPPFNALSSTVESAAQSAVGSLLLLVDCEPWSIAISRRRAASLAAFRTDPFAISPTK
jgi:hypothetical protein